uniref:Uncharacterized protein n=1 Tax=Anguilla anguilla TaxID=7936 RepID=A0A0E9XZ18_ANGAN
MFLEIYHPDCTVGFHSSSNTAHLITPARDEHLMSGIRWN